MDGWTLGSTISYDAQAAPTTPPELEPEIEVEPLQCVEESVSWTPLTEAVADSASVTPAAPDQAAISQSQEAPEVCFGFAAMSSY